MHTYYFSVSLSYEECRLLYLPENYTVVVTEEQGKRIQIHSKNLRPFVSQTGLRGRFRLLINNEKKLISLDKVS
jgi:hypothetical protein